MDGRWRKKKRLEMEIEKGDRQKEKRGERGGTMEDGRGDRATRSSEAIVDSSFSLSFHPNGRCIGLAARAHSPSLSLSLSAGNGDRIGYFRRKNRVVCSVLARWDAAALHAPDGRGGRRLDIVLQKMGLVRCASPSSPRDK